MMKSKNGRLSGLVRPMILFGIWLSTLYWVLGSLLDAFFYREGPLLQQLVAPTGQQFWARFLVIFILFVSSLLGVIAFERRRIAEDAAKRQKELSRTYLDVAGTIIVVIDRDQKIKLINKKGCETLGYQEEKIVGKNWFDLAIPSKIRDEIRGFYEKMMSGELESIEYTEIPVQAKDGEEKIIAWHHALLRDEEGNITGTISSGEDITERVQSEAALHESEIKYSTVVEQAADGVIIIQDEKLQFVNSAIAKTYGSTVEEMVGKSFVEFIAPESRELVMSNHRARFAGAEVADVYEAKLLRKDGEKRDIEISGAVIQYHGKPAVMGIIRDITDRRREEKKRAEERMQLLSIFDSIDEVVYVSDPETYEILFINEATRKIFGDVVGEKCHKALQNSNSPCSFCTNDIIFKEKPGKVHIWEFQNSLNSRWYRCMDKAITWPDGRNVRYEMAIDITDRKRVEEALRESEERFKSIFDNAVVGIYRTTPDGQILAANPKLLEMLGYSSLEELQELNLEIGCHSFETPRSVFQEFIERDGYVAGIESAWIKKDGTPINIRESATAIRDETGKTLFYEGTVEDITDEKRSEKIQAVHYKIAQATGTSESLEELLRAIHQELGTLIDATNFYVALYNEENGLYSFPYYVDQHDELGAFDEEELPDSMTDYVRRKGIPVIVDEDAFRKLEAEGEVKLVGTPSPIWMGVPLKASGKIIGVVALQSYTNKSAYDQQDLDLLTFVSENIALAIQRKRSDEALRIEKAYLEQLFECAPEAVVIVDNDNKILRINSEFTRLFGYNPDEAIGQSIDQLLAPKGLIKEAHALTKSVVHGESVALESVRQRKDGTLVDVSILGTPIKVGDGQVAVYAIYRDITDRKRAEEELRASEAKSQAILSAMPDLMFQIDRKGTMLQCHGPINDQCVKPDELMGKSIKEIMPPDVASKALNLIELALESGKLQFFEYEFQKDDDLRYFECRMVAGGDDKVLAIVRNITNRKRTEETRETILNINKHLLGELDLERAMEAVSPELQKLAPHDLLAFTIIHKELDQVEVLFISPDGRIRSDGEGRIPNPYRETYHGSLIQQILHERRDRVTTRIPTAGTNLDQNFRKMGMNSFIALPLINVGVPLGMLFLASEKEDGFSSQAQEMLEHIHLQLVLWIQHHRLIERLSESESKFRTLFDNSNDPIYILQGNRFVYVNRKFEELLEYKLDEVNKPDFDFQRLVAPESIPIIEERTRRMKAGEKLPSNYEFKGLSKSGKVIDFDVNVSYITFDGESATQGILRDISERKRFEERQKDMQLELMQNSKLASIGMLAAGIAHNINVPLQGISNHIEMLKMTRDDIPYLDSMHNQVHRISAIINNMLYKSRQEQDQSVREIDLNQLLVEELTFLNADLVFKHDIEKEYQFDPELPKIKGVYSDFSQALLNIIKNALDAMHSVKKKKLSVKTQATSDGNILVEIRDTGRGISSEHLDHIFDPFFTTKPPAGDNGDEPAGTGLGLSTSYQLLRKYKARFEVESEVGHGTSLRIHLPMDKTITIDEQSKEVFEPDLACEEV